MTSRSKVARDLRAQARNARAQAQQMIDRTTRWEMLAIAHGYEVLADHAEKLNVSPLNPPEHVKRD